MLGHVALVLHAHLPWVRHPEHARPLEERWLHEALWESYLPLLAMLDRLASEGVSAALTVSVSPPLAAMLADPQARARSAEAARRTVDALGGALGRTLQSLDPYLMHLLLPRRDSHA